ncbi:hypothetical protein C3L33_19690, partial [Rhododendron williamsianum]
MQISPWHDIPLQLGDGVFNCIVEIPKESSAKMRYNINWNYGLLPQTWEDPSLANSEVDGALGDNDPVDVVEIGESRGKVGQILRVKPLAALAMIDEGELDWKIVAISWMIQKLHLLMTLMMLKSISRYVCAGLKDN